MFIRVSLSLGTRRIFLMQFMSSDGAAVIGTCHQCSVLFNVCDNYFHGLPPCTYIALAADGVKPYFIPTTPFMAKRI